tara:strand:- start:2085 stop:2654 length:570 start_codon:yes stop_codon:yes gene_type:complete
MKKIAVLFSVVLTLSACASPYQSKGFSGGFSETQLSENVFQVSFRGNGYTSSERASDFAMLRSAELTLENGYKYFALADNQNAVENSSYTTPVQAHTTGYSNTYGTLNTYGNYGTYSGSTYGNATTTFTGGQTYNIRKPKSMNTIVMFHKKPKQGLVLDAEFLERTLREKYKLLKEEAVPEETEDSPTK